MHLRESAFPVVLILIFYDAVRCSQEVQTVGHDSSLPHDLDDTKSHTETLRNIRKRATRHANAEYYFANNQQADGWLTSSNYPFPHYRKSVLDYVFLFRIGVGDVDKLHSICLRFSRFDYAPSPPNYSPCTSASLSFAYSELSSTASAGSRLSAVGNPTNGRYCEDGRFTDGQATRSYTTLANGDRLNSVLPGSLFDSPICFLFTINATRAAGSNGNVRWRAITMQLSAKESELQAQANYGMLARFSMQSVSLDAGMRDSLLVKNFDQPGVNCTKECAAPNDVFFDWNFSQTSFKCECLSHDCSFNCSPSMTTAVCESYEREMLRCSAPNTKPTPSLGTNIAYEQASIPNAAAAATRIRAVAASTSPRCIPFSSICNRVPDCADGIDEKLSLCAPASLSYTPLACDFSGVFCNFQNTIAPQAINSAEDHTGSSSSIKRGSLRIDSSSSVDRQTTTIFKAHVLPSRYVRAAGNQVCVGFYFKIKSTRSTMAQQPTVSDTTGDQAPTAVRFEPYLVVISRMYHPIGPTVLFVASLLHSASHDWQKGLFEIPLVGESTSQVEFLLISDSTAQLALFIDDISDANGPCRIRDTLDCTFELGMCGWTADPPNGFERAAISINASEFAMPMSIQSTSNKTVFAIEPQSNFVWIDHSNLILLQTHSSSFSMLQLSQIAANGSIMRARSSTSAASRITLRSIMLNNEARSTACFTMWAICIANPIGAAPNVNANPNGTDGVPAVLCGTFRFTLENAVGYREELVVSESETELRQRFASAAYTLRRRVTWQLRRVTVPPTFDIAAYRLNVEFTFAPHCAVKGGGGSYDCTVGIDDVQLIRAVCYTIEVDPDVAVPTVPPRTCRRRVPRNFTSVNVSTDVNITDWIEIDGPCEDYVHPIHAPGMDTVHLGALIALGALLVCVVVSAVIYFWRKYNAPDDDDDDDDQLDFGAASHPIDRDDEIDSEGDEDGDQDGDPDGMNTDALERGGERDVEGSHRNDGVGRGKRIDQSILRRRGNESLDDTTNGCSSSTDDEYFYGMPADADAERRTHSKGGRHSKAVPASRAVDSKRKKDSMSSNDEKTSADRMLGASPSGATANVTASGRGVSNNAVRYSSNLSNNNNNNNNHGQPRRTTSNTSANSGSASVRFANSSQASNSNPYPNGNRVDVQVRPNSDETTIPKDPNVANGRKQVYTTLALVERNPQATATRTQLAAVSNGSPHDRIWNANEANDEYDLQNECTV